METFFQHHLQSGRAVSEHHADTPRCNPADLPFALHTAPLSSSAVLFCLVGFFLLAQKAPEGTNLRIFLVCGVWYVVRGVCVLCTHGVSLPRSSSG